MATRYLIFVADDVAARDALMAGPVRRIDLPVVFAEGRVVILAHGDVVHMGAHGFVIGHLFHRGDNPRRVTNAEARAFEGVGGQAVQRLLERYWGGYVAIFSDPHDGVISVLRDPSATMPSLYSRRSGWTLIASDLQTLAAEAQTMPEIAWDVLTRYLIEPESIDGQTCLTGVTELLPGSCARFTNRGVRLEQCWSPWDHAGRDPIRNIDQAADALAGTVSGCIQAWIDGFDHMTLGISGGLDSSIIASSFANGPDKLTGFTMVGPNGNGDERDYARAVSGAFGLPMDEFRYDVNDINLCRSSAAHLPRPSTPYFFQAIEAAHKTIEARRPVDAYLTGTGGDNVFCYMRSAAPLSDRYLTHGLGTGLWTTVRDISDLTECSVWTVAKLAWKKRKLHPQAHRWQIDTRFLDPAQARLLSPTTGHPWLDFPPDALPGKSSHVAMILRTLRNLECYPRSASGPQIAPLLSQPVVELCLRVPTWLWCAGGVNRAPARRAFQSRLPSVVIRRTSKGGPNGFMLQLFARKRGQIRSLLRNGLLAAHHMINVDAIDAAFADGAIPKGDEPIRLLKLASTEAWLQAQLGHQPAKHLSNIAS